MSTYDVPGYRAHNHDQLASGCWAEHQDGSLMVVGSVDAGYVRFLVFDRSKPDLVVYADAMPESDFMADFSGGAGGITWTWHDKTPFPWDTLVSPVAPSAAASRVASKLGLEPHILPPREVKRLMASHGIDGNQQFIEAFDVLAAR